MIGDVEVRPAGEKGLGVFARKSFAKGEFIFRRRNGPVIDAAGLAKLSPDDQMHLTELGRDRFAVVLPPGAYLNHACDPNAMRSGVKVFAWQPIRAGDEITIDYRLNAFDGSSWPCACGSVSCTGTVVSSFFALPADRQQAYLPFAPAFIHREYRERLPPDDASTLEATLMPAMTCVLLTGMSATGKSSVIEELIAHGYKAIDLDHPKWSETAPDGEWLWREDRVRELLSESRSDVLFVSSCAANQGKFHREFDGIVLLSAPVDTIVGRLSTRTNNAFGKRPDELAQVLRDIEETEPKLRRTTSIEIDTTIPLNDVVLAVLRFADSLSA